jgi:hypothetical protein
MKYLCLLFFIACSNALYAAGIDRNFLATGRDYRFTADTDTIVRKKSVSVGVSYGSDALFLLLRVMPYIIVNRACLYTVRCSKY